MAVRAWNLMGGLDWSALPVVAEMLGIVDVALLVEQLVLLREHQRPK